MFRVTEPGGYAPTSFPVPPKGLVEVVVSMEIHCFVSKPRSAPHKHSLELEQKGNRTYLNSKQ